MLHSTISPAMLEALFPFYLVVDPSARIHGFGPRMPRLIPQISVGQALSDHFAAHRPGIELTWDALIANQQRVLILRALRADAKLRGQVLYHEDDDVLYFFGSPWVTDLAELRRLGLSLGDFALNDSISEFLLQRQTQHMALTDARELASRLAEQHAELRAAKEAADEASRTKSQFLARMSHELRTPMTGVLGMLQLLMLEPLTQEALGQARLAYDSAETLLRILDDILDFSKIEAGKMTLERAAFSLPEVLASVQALLLGAAERKGLSLTVSGLGAAPQWVLGDAVRLRQVLINLLGNAIKFTHEGGVLLQVARDGEALRFTVSDTGIGIPKDVITRLFQPFTQADNSTARRFGGSGLGLAICRSLVTMMGGALTVTSQPGEGSTFSFTALLPAQDPPPPRLKSPAPRAIAPRSDLQVLLVEDNPVNQLVAQRLLERLGARVSVAQNGLLAVRACQSGRFDLVLMDCHMPEMDGFSATEAIRALEQSRGRARTPVVALSASVLPEERARCLAVGMDDFLAKPVRGNELAQVVARWTS